jgi:hypothetical protein
LWFDETAVIGTDDGLCAVAVAELGQHVSDMGLDGFRADDELRGDLGVRQALGDQAQDLALAVGEPGALEPAAGGEAGWRGLPHRGAHA